LKILWVFRANGALTEIGTALRVLRVSLRPFAKTVEPSVEGVLLLSRRQCHALRRVFIAKNLAYYVSS